MRDSVTTSAHTAQTLVAATDQYFPLCFSVSEMFILREGLPDACAPQSPQKEDLLARMRQDLSMLVTHHFRERGLESCELPALSDICCRLRVCD